jgi:uncharacterized protein (DUF427 family)
VAGRTIADTQNALTLREANYPPVYQGRGHTTDRANHLLPLQG